MSKIVNRTLDLFEAFAAHRSPLSLTELVKVLAIPLSSCHDIARALEQRGYIYEVRPRRGFYPTAKLYDLSREIFQNDPIVRLAEPILQDICDRFRVSAWLGKAKGTQITYLAVCRSSDPLSYNVAVGDTTRSLYATSSGKALLAGLPAKERKKIISQLTLRPFTSATITSKAMLEKDLHLGETRGWFMNREESVDDSLSVSTRFEWNGSTYTITVAGSVNRVDRELEKIIQGAVAAAARLKSQEIVWP